MRQVKTLIALSISLILLPAVGSWARADEKRVKMKQLPKAVQQTVRAQSKGGRIREISRETENGNTYYEIELFINGRKRDVLIDSTGAVVEVEEEVSFDSLPQAVRAGIENHSEGGKVVFVESITRNDAVVAYEAQIKAAKTNLEVKVGLDGSLISKENDEDEAEERASSGKGSQKSKKP